MKQQNMDYIYELNDIHESINGVIFRIYKTNECEHYLLLLSSKLRKTFVKRKINYHLPVEVGR